MLYKTFLYMLIGIYQEYLIYGSPIDKSLKLELVQVLFRHGARTPIDCEAKVLSFADASTYEPWGYAQLTNQGMMQEYRIGKMLRERYKDFLPDTYKAEDAYLYASGVSRTKASLELVLAALYPPTSKLIWNPKLDWVPIAIHSDPRPLDILMKPRDCPKYKEVLKTLYNTTEVKEASAEHDEILKTLEKIFGKPYDLSDMFCAYNAIVVHKNMNLTLPDWYTDTIFVQMKKASVFYLETLSYNNTLKRLNGGTLVRRFVENIDKSNSKLNRRKLYLYSAHDKTLHAFSTAHNLTLPRTPDYGSAIIVEKLRDELNTTYVKLYLWSGEPKQLSALKLEKCAENCPLEEYLKIVNPVLATDDEMLCLYKNLQPKDIQNILTTDLTIIED